MKKISIKIKAEELRRKLNLRDGVDGKSIKGDKGDKGEKGDSCIGSGVKLQDDDRE